MDEFTVICNNESKDLAKKIAKKIGSKNVVYKLKIFSDGEGKITINSIKKTKKIIVLHPICPPVDSNLIRMLSLIYEAKKYSSHVVAVITYMGYARQDKKFLEGEIVTIDVIVKLLESIGTTSIIVVDIHNEYLLSKFKIPIVNISAIPLLAKYILQLQLQNPLVVSPDIGSIKRTKELANIIKSDYIVLKKNRDRANGTIEIESNKLHKVSKKDLILVDDMITTGNSIIKAVQLLKKNNCKKIFVICTHAILVEKAEDNIINSGVESIISTNTVPSCTSVVDVSSLISKNIKKLVS